MFSYQTQWFGIHKHFWDIADTGQSTQFIPNKYIDKLELSYARLRPAEYNFIQFSAIEDNHHFWQVGGPVNW